MTPKLEIGFTAPQDRQQVEDLEAMGADSLWVGGHIASTNPSPEALIWLARLAEQTERVAIGTATLLLPLYPPGIVAKQIADLDRAATGRLRLGIGVGGEYLSDFGASEVPIDERGSRTDEAIDLLRQFWTGQPITHHGRHHTFENIRIHPPPAQPSGPPIIVSGRKPVAMRRAARVGDGWMPYLYSPERYARSVATIREEADRHGRDLTDFGWYAYIFVSMDEDPTAARTAAQGFFGNTYRDNFEEFLDRVACVGTPEQVTERLRGFVQAGARHLILVPCDRQQETYSRLLTEIRPLLGE